MLTQSGWTKGNYGINSAGEQIGNSTAVLYFKETNAGRSEIIFNYGGGIHSGGQTFNKPYYYKLTGPEFGYTKYRVIDQLNYPDLNNALNDTYKLIDGPTGTIIPK